MAFKPPDLRNRSPKVEILPDLRQRVTRVYDILDEVAKNQTGGAIQPGVSDYALEWGTADAVPASQGSSYPNCLLIKQDIEGQFEINGTTLDKPTEKKPTLTRVYEQISATGETKVGQDDTTIDPDGLTEVTQKFLQFSKAVPGITPIFLTVGTSTITAENGTTCVLKQEKRTDNGTVQQIQRDYISKGLISQTDETKFNGGLLIRTLTYVNQVPPTPGGYTLITAKVDHPGGLPVYTYTFALGNGQISQLTEYRLSPDQGTTGVTVTTIEWLTVPGASNPISPPGGAEEISIKWDDADGYMKWTGVYASGQGTILTNIEVRNGGKLIITSITAINAAPSAPSPSIGGTPTLIKQEQRNGTRFEDGTVIYDYAWAEGEGQISKSVTYENSVDEGVHGITKTATKYLTATSISSNPITGTGAQTVNDYQDEGGYRLWTAVFVSGTGTISSDTETKEFGCLKIYRLTAINTPPSAPGSTIGGSVVLIDAESKIENGVTVYTYRWAEGEGLITDESTVMEAGVLVTYHRVSLGVAPTAPSGMIGGSVTLFESDLKNADGYQIYDYRWVEANGQSSITTRGEADGSILYEVVTKTASATTPSYPGGGSNSLIELKHEQGNGYMTNRATYRKWPATAVLPRHTKYRLPGSIGILSSPDGLQFNPPVDMELTATETISYATSVSGSTAWTVTAWPFVATATVPTNQSTPKQTVTTREAVAGYLSAGTGSSGGPSPFNGVPCDTWEYTISASNPTTPPSGSTIIEVQSDIYLVDTSGTVVYRNKVTTYSF